MYVADREVCILNRPLSKPPSLLASLHTHSNYCDGHGRIEEYARAAIRANLVAYGASSHAPLPFQCDYAMPLSALDPYRSDVRHVAATYNESIPVFLGLELDYLPGLTDFYANEFLTRGFDYFVASVHYVGGKLTDAWAYDESEEKFVAEVASRHGGDARPVVEDYYRRIGQMVQEISDWSVPAFVGHLDRINLWNRDDRYFPTDDSWYREVVDDALLAIRRSGLPVELNTSGWAKPVAAPNPNAAILRRCAELGIPSIVSSDAHYPSHVDRYFDDGLELLKDAGIRHVIVPGRHGWQSVPLTDNHLSDPLIPGNSPSEVT